MHATPSDLHHDPAVAGGAAATSDRPGGPDSTGRRGILPRPAPAPAPRSRGTRPTRLGGGGGSPSPTRMLLWGLAAVLALGGGAVATGAVQLQRPDDGGPADRVGRDADSSWSYYHDTDYVSDAGGVKWETDHTRSTDPAEAALGTTSRWEYDGPYQYGSYGSDGMRQRAAGRETADPLYSQSNPTLDVFSQAPDLDPSGGQPVGMAPSSQTNPYFDPYAGYSNPYANRIRLGYGEGIGRGASTDF